MFLDAIPDHQQHAIELHAVHFRLDIGNPDSDALDQQRVQELVDEPLTTHIVPADVQAGD